MHGLSPAQTQLGASLLVMSIIGGAIVSPLMGSLVDCFGINAAFVAPAICFCCVFAFAASERSSMECNNNRAREHNVGDDDASLLEADVGMMELGNIGISD
eukprot:SAG31_NODE_3810_length_3862_cov_2.467712_3_plen_101_part_00